MSYTLAYQGAEIDDILGRAAPGGALDTAIAAKQDALTFDAVPTEGSTNPAESGGIYDAIQAGGAAALAAFATDSVSGDVVSFPDGADGIPVKSFVGSIIPAQSGSGDPAPDNVRPISGWSGAEITRCGANVMDATWEQGAISYDQWNQGAAYSNFKSASTTRARTVNLIDLPTTEPCTVSVDFATYEALARPFNANGGSTTLSNAGYDNAWHTSAWQISGAPKCALMVRKKNDATITAADVTAAKVQINIGSTALPYEPYNGQTITLTFGSTVYAGTLTALGGGLWKIQPTHAALTLNGSESWAAYASGNGYRMSVSGMSSGEAQTGWADWLATVTNLNSLGIEFGRNDTRIYAAQANTIPGVTDLASWKSYLSNNNLVIVYPLATLPDPIIVTGSDLATLLGSNTVWLDCGSVTGMTYRADTALYIQKLLNGGGTLQTLSMASPSPSLSLGRVGVLAEPEEAELEQTEEEAEQLEQTEEAEEE